MKNNILRKLIYSKKARIVICCLLVFAVLFGPVPSPRMSDNDEGNEDTSYNVYAEGEGEGDDPNFPNGTITLRPDQFGEYSRAAAIYQKYHQHDIINIRVQSGTEPDVDVNNFRSLGSEKYPFCGEIRIEATASNLVLNLDAPLFDYVYDSVKLNQSNSSRPLGISRISGTDSADTPILANHVIHDDAGTAATWYVNVTSPSTGGSLQDFGGFIGKLWKNYASADSSSPASTGSAALTVNATMNKTSTDTRDITIGGTSDLGLLCGFMDETTSLTFTLVSDRKVLDIETSSGNVGGLVGTMSSGSTLSYTGGNIQTDAKNIKTDNGFAGGIVGSNTEGNITLSTSPYPVKQVIVGTEGTGGIYGYYNPDSSNDLTVSTGIYIIDCTLSGKGDNGGLFGVLETAANTAISLASTVNTTHTDGATSGCTYGGLIGTYKVDSKAHAMTITGTSDGKVSANNVGGSQFFGGGIGVVDSSTTSYVKFDNFLVDKASNAGNLTFGGLVASADNSFVDANDVTIKVNKGYKGGGLVGRITSGVLRMSGYTTLTNAAPTGPGSGEEIKIGQLVGYRDDALIYAKSGWEFNRFKPNSDYNGEIDDIGAWGEVIRLSSSSLTGLFTEDDTSHKVTINKPSVSYTSIGGTLDFVKTALCFQLAENDYIDFENEDYDWSTIKAQDITLTGNVDLSGTGITGLTRDNNIGSSDHKFEYSGTIKSDSTKRKITLAVGEPYGKRDGTAITDYTTAGGGRIYRHAYNGLIGYSDGATVDKISFDGNISVKANAAMYAGAVAAYAAGEFIAGDIDVTTSFKYSGSSALELGGILGEASDSIDGIDISDCTITCDISGGNSAEKTSIGGVIGRIDYTTFGSNEWKLTDVSVSGNITNTWAAAHSRMGALIAKISGCSNGDASAEQNRELQLSKVSVSNLTLTSAKNDTKNGDTLKSMGGLLGYSWLNVNVDFDSVSVKNSTLNFSNIKSGYGDMAGLVYEGTGHWTVDDSNDVKVDNITVNPSGGNASFGMFVNKAWYGIPSGTGSSALFLELKNTSAYTIANEDDTKLPAFTVFDELVAYSAYYEQDDDTDTRRTAPDGDADNPYILQNGAAIISIKTDVEKGLNMDNGTTASHSYTPQTSRGKTSAINPNTRYYYNLDRLSGASPTDDTNAGRLMRWGLRQYAHSSIKNCFTNGGTFTDTSIPNLTYEMQGYSWYPVDVDESVSVNGTFKLYNKEFEGSEAKANGDHVTRSSLLLTQHYLLHDGLFRNVNTNQTLTIGTVTLQGNVGLFRSYSDASKFGSGALICGRVQGAQDKKAVVKVNGSIDLDRVYVHDITESTDYAPLAINKVGDHSQLSIKAATKITYDYDEETGEDIVNCYSSISDDNSKYPGMLLVGTGQQYPKAGTSLIGDAGLSSSPVGIILDFSSMKLDGRTADITVTGTNSGDNTYFDDIYGSKRTIFTKATFLNSFKYDSGSFGKYDFTWNEDWKKINKYEFSHFVTYGKELGYLTTNSGSTSEYPGKELWYSGEDHTTGRYTNPGNINDRAGNYSQHFIEEFLPYVYAGYDKANDLHQIMVNQTAADFTGCGTYNDPYIINTGKQLGSVSSVLNGIVQNNFQLNIPNKKANNVIKPDTGATWHNEDCGDTSYKYLPSSTTPAVTDPETGDVLTPEITYSAGFYKNGIYVTPNGTDTDDFLTLGTVQKYLAGAYYKIGNVEKITIESGDGFLGLGYSGNNPSNNQHAIFRGVFIGDNKEIVNNTKYPFISTSNGSVVKNLTLTIGCSDNIKVSGTNKAFDASGFYAYGGLIGKIFGGDNIIDNVLVDYSGFNKLIQADGTNAQLVPIGGYVGVVVNGGVIFRNMTERAGNYAVKGLTNAKISATGSYPTGVSNDKMLDDDPYGGWLYVNPIIGRVINGFAITESSKYHPFENGYRQYGDGSVEIWNTSGSVTKKTKQELDAMSESGRVAVLSSGIGVTLRNGTKHYSITDIKSVWGGSTTNPSLSYTEDGTTKYYLSENEKLNTSTASDIKIPNGQAFFLMSLMINSGMAQGKVGYNQPYQMPRSACYSGIKTDLNGSQPTDYSSYAKNEYLGSDSKVKNERAGYLSLFYTTDTAANLSSRKNMISGMVTLTDSGTYYLSDGFKGIGTMYADDSNRRLAVSKFTGNGATISMNSSYYYYYSKKTTNAISPTNNTVDDYKNDVFDSAYKHRDDVGFGLFNNQYGETKNSTDRYYNFTLTGNVICDCIDNKSGEHIPYFCTISDAVPSSSGKGYDYGIDRLQMVSAGMLIGTSNKQQYLDSVALVNINVKGVRNAGGLIGWIPESKTTYINNLSKASERIKVHSGGSVGGMIGKSYNGMIVIDNNNATYSISEVVSDCDYRSGYDYNYGVGGFIGFCRNKDKLTKTNSSIISISNVIVGDKNAVKATTVECNKDCIGGLITGGLIGMQNKATLYLDNCKVFNQSVKSPYLAGGLLGYIASTSTATDINNTTQKKCNLSFITNTEVFSNSTSGAKIECTGMHSVNGNKTYYVGAGGFISGIKHEMGSVVIRNSSIEGYDIEGKEIAGGAVGIFGHYPTDGGTNSDNELHIENFKIIGCNIKATESGSTSYVGGLVGIIFNHNKWKDNSDVYQDKFLYGYNILAKNLTFTGGNQGTICGWRNYDADNLIKLAGFSRQDDRTGGNNKMIADLVGSYPTKSASNTSPTSDNLYGMGGYVIFADYKDVASGTSPNKLFSSFNSSDNVLTMRSVSTVTRTESIELNGTTKTNSTSQIIYGAYDSEVGSGTKTVSKREVISYPTDKNRWRVATTVTTNGVTGATSYTEAVGVPEGTDTTQVTTITTATVTRNENFPFVTSNPKQNIDSTQYLTGDAMGTIDYNQTSFNKIVTDNSAKRYQMYAAVVSADDIANVKEHFSSSHKEFISLKAGIVDFPVLVVEDTVAANVTSLINGYIRTLTNTTYNYAINQPGIYQVDISKMVYDGSVFVQESDANLVRNDGSFQMKNNSYDTNETPTFTLVDVQFIDPSSTSNEIAYHLYVPVYVKKLLQYNFYASLASNTEYYKEGSGYQLKSVGGKNYFYNNKLFENLGNPVTLAFEYVYTRSESEWIASLNGGENVLSDSNFRKSLVVNRLNITEWPSDMKMVLVDSTKGGKNYYLDESELPTGNSPQVELNLSKFHDADDSTKTHTPSPFNDLMVIEVESGNDLIRTNKSDPDATFKDKDDYYYKPKGDATTGSFYSVSSVVIKPERYYLSFFTKKLPGPDEAGYDATQYNKIYYYSIKSKEKFERDNAHDGNEDIVTDWRPNKIANNSYPILLIGNLYDITFELKANSKEEKELMTNSNNYISVEMLSTVSLTSVATDPVREIYKIFDLGEDEVANISQTFLMAYSMREKMDEDEKVGLIKELGSIESEEYYIQPGAVDLDHFDKMDPTVTNITGDAEYLKTDNYLELRNNQNLIDYLADSNHGHAVTLYSYIDYLYGATELPKQFPNKDENSSDPIGTLVIGYSNISSSVDTAAYSANSARDEGQYRYYTQGTSKSAVLSYYMKEDTSGTSEELAKARADGKYRSLGINALETDLGHIKSVADYDTHVLTTKGDYIELTLTLSKKSSYVTPTVGNPVVSGIPLEISNYLSGLKIYGKDGVIFDQDEILDGSFAPGTGVTVSVQDLGTLYKVRVRKDKVETLGEASDGRYVFDIEYDVKTGDGEDADCWNDEYSNYKVSVTAAMYPDATESTAQKDSYDFDHIIYTNAKVVSDVIGY